MERYYISQVKKNIHGVVTDVMLHFSNGQTLSTLGVKNTAFVIQLINSGNSVYTMIWGYPTWQSGAEVSVVRSADGRSYLRTNRNQNDRDNLDNLFPLQN